MNARTFVAFLGYSNGDKNKRRTKSQRTALIWFYLKWICLYYIHETNVFHWHGKYVVSKHTYLSSVLFNLISWSCRYFRQTFIYFVGILIMHRQKYVSSKAKILLFLEDITLYGLNICDKRKYITTLPLNGIS